MSYAFMLVAMVAVLFASFVAMSVARWVIARVLGLRGVGLVSVAPPEAVPPRAIVTILAGSALATYGLAAALFAAAFFVGGKSIFGTSVAVVPGRSAAEAGIENGDRVVAIAGQKIETWEAIAPAIRARVGQATDVTVARGDVEIHFTITPAADGKIGIVAMPIQVDIPIAEAIMSGIAAPFRYVASVARGTRDAFSGREVTAAGPVGIVKSVAAQSSRGSAALVLNLLGAAGTYAWLPAALLSLRGLTGKRGSAKRRPTDGG